jgi:uncharacterized protein
MKLRNIFVSAVVFAIFAIATLTVTVSAGDVNNINESTPLDQLKALAAQGNAEAMLNLGERQIQSEGAEKNLEEGMQWLRKAIDAGKHRAYYDLGFVYSNGLIDGKPDIAEAMKYFRKGAELGNSDCQTSMGLLFQAGERIPGGVKADPVEAVKWYRLAADQNHTEAIQHLAMLYVTGQGVKQDAAEAAKWFRKGAELGDSDSKWGLGQCYLDGKGVGRDSVMAYVLFSAAVGGVENPQQKQAMSEVCSKLGKAMTAEQLKKSDPLIQEWKTKGRH